MKLFGWLSKLLISTVLISTLSVLTTWYVVNLYVEEIIRQYQLPVIGNKIQFSDILARLSEQVNISKPKTDPGPSAATTKGLDAIQDSTGTSGRQNMGATPSPTPVPGSDRQTESTKPTAAGVNKDDAVAVWGQAGQGSGSADTGTQKDLVISTEEFTKRKDMLSSEDKMKIFSLVVSKLSQDEVQHLSTILEGGITATEMKEVDQILQKYLKKEEYQQLLDVLGKY